MLVGISGALCTDFLVGLACFWHGVQFLHVFQCEDACGNTFQHLS